MDEAVAASLRGPGLATGQRSIPWPIILAAAFVAVVAVNPLGYIGGGWDDWQYLTAARCWAEHGACVPRTHWEGRWPVFAPIAAIFAMLGESRTTLSIWPLACSIAALCLLVVVGNKALGRPIGWIGALLFLATPAFSIQILAPSVEALELAIVLAGVCCALWWNERRSPGWALAAGLCFGLALQVRETSMIAAAFAGMWVLSKRPKLSDLLFAAAGFALPLAVELLVYLKTTGDPLFRRHLSLSHTQIPSSELLGPIDSKHGPFFNPAYIANWRHEPGIHVHWLIDGFLNLFMNAKAGLSLGLTAVLLLVFRSETAAAQRRSAFWLWGLAILYAAALIYALAIDPKARMMFLPLSASCLGLALLVISLWRTGKRLLPVAVVTTHALAGLTILFIHQRTDFAEIKVAEWLTRFPGQIETDANTRRHLALVPGAAQLPDLNSGKPYWIYSSLSNCSLWLRKAQLSDGRIAIVEEIPTSRKALFISSSGSSLCLFRRNASAKSTSPRVSISRSAPTTS